MANYELEKNEVSHEETPEQTDEHSLKLDQHGFPLKPQPSDDPKDPLNWNKWLKLWVLAQVAFLGFLGPFTQAITNSAYLPMAKSLHISVVDASYQVTITIAVAGVVPFFWSPLSNVYGRRPVFIFLTAVAVASHAASGAASTWSGILTARAFVGVGVSAGLGIGSACVADMYFMHERGKYMGIFIVFLTNGAHLAAVVGGYITLNLGWRWCYWVSAIMAGITWLVNLFCLPETLYHRDSHTGRSLEPVNQPWLTKFTFRSVRRRQRLTSFDFTHCLIMFRYPSVLFPGIYYTISYGVASVLFAVTGSAAFGKLYHFNPAQIGLAIGLSTFIGTLLGELCAGPVSDYLVFLHARSHSGDSVPEARLHAIWPGAFLVPLGVIIEGVCIQAHTPWPGPVMGIAIAAFGLQIISTNVYAYPIDCYRPQSAEISILLNFGRSIFSFTLGFYAIRFAEATTWGTAWGVFAIIHVLAFVPVVFLMWKGQTWRERLGAPNFNKEL